MGTCSENCPVMTGFHGGLGSSGGYCLLLTALCGLELVGFGNKGGHCLLHVAS